MQMNEWYAAHKQKLKNMLEANAFKDTSLLLPLLGPEFIKDIKTVLASFDKQKIAWVRAKPAFIPGQQKCWHTVCANCHKNVDADIDWIITCPSCNESTSIQMRCRIGIKLADETGKMNCTIYSPEVEKLIPYTTIQLHDAYETGVALDMQLAESISKHTVVYFVRSFEVEYQSQQQKKNAVVKLYTLEALPQMITSINHEDPPNVQTQLMTPTIIEVKARESEDMITPLPAPTIEDKSAINTSATAAAPAKSSAKRSLNFTSKAANSISSVVDEASMLIEEDDNKQQSSITFELETSRYKQA
ncbi:uncharacterized protein [Coffea arabica]|uniref:Uncharacterized protein isoform X2 n=1 Tax=Coffea arabica TaxID=13443 RepID=A0A6P6U169_COFAR|nr:uncharacterized protein LOC113706574 [Coffea arabica]XP_027084299.1 uncharacterized protein LOC113706574 [Coffea arabica]XP_027084301.1 uncharacterized protein LOC113706574 [Coffea arabica]